MFVGWQQEYGGFTSYIAKGEDEEVSIYLFLFKFNWVHLNGISAIFFISPNPDLVIVNVQ